MTLNALIENQLWCATANAQGGYFFSNRFSRNDFMESFIGGLEDQWINHRAAWIPKNDDTVQSTFEQL